MNKRSIIKSVFSTIACYLGYGFLKVFTYNRVDDMIDPLDQRLTGDEIFCIFFDFAIIFYHFYRMVEKRRRLNNYISEEDDLYY
jgi:hypothetical protein